MGNISTKGGNAERNPVDNYDAHGVYTGSKAAKEKEGNRIIALNQVASDRENEYENFVSVINDENEKPPTYQESIASVRLDSDVPRRQKSVISSPENSNSPRQKNIKSKSSLLEKKIRQLEKRIKSREDEIRRFQEDSGHKFYQCKDSKNEVFKIEGVMEAVAFNNEFKKEEVAKKEKLQRIRIKNEKDPSACQEYLVKKIHQLEEHIKSREDESARFRADQGHEFYGCKNNKNEVLKVRGVMEAIALNEKFKEEEIEEKEELNEILTDIRCKKYENNDICENGHGNRHSAPFSEEFPITYGAMPYIFKACEPKY